MDHIEQTIIDFAKKIYPRWNIVKFGSYMDDCTYGMLENGVQIPYQTAVDYDEEKGVFVDINNMLKNRLRKKPIKK